MDTLSPVSQRH